MGNFQKSSARPHLHSDKLGGCHLSATTSKQMTKSNTGAQLRSKACVSVLFPWGDGEGC